MPMCQLEILLRTHQCHPMEVGQRTAICLKSIFNVDSLLEGFLAFLPPKASSIIYPPPQVESMIHETKKYHLLTICFPSFINQIHI